MPSTGISPDFKSMASMLASIIETTTVSLYDLQTSLINAHGPNTTYSPHPLISQIRPRFKELWEDIRFFLQMSHAYGGDVIILEESLGRESAKDCMEFLIVIGNRSAQLLESAETLASNAINLMEDFLSLIPEFEKTLLNSITPVYRTNFGRYELESSAQEPRPRYSREDSPQCYARRWIERPIIVEPSNVDKATQAFVEASIAAICPDGQKSLDDTIGALDDMNLMLTQFIQYWRSRSKYCQRYILSGSINIKAKRANSFAIEWRANRAALEGAILGIAKSCDAVLVDAVGIRSPAALSPPTRRSRAPLVKAIRETTPHPPLLPPRATYYAYESYDRGHGKRSWRMPVKLKCFFWCRD